MKTVLAAFSLALLAACSSPQPSRPHGPPPPQESQQEIQQQTAAPSSQHHEYLVSHILCSSEEDAKRVLERINRGESFADAAARFSIDPGTRGQGGRINSWGPAENFVFPFAQEVRRLPVGGMSDHPIETQFGWHIVRVDAIR